MEPYIWIVCAVLVSLIMAGRRISNQCYKLPAKELVLATKFGVTLLCVPLLFFIKWPTSPYFYIFSALAAPLAYYKDMIAYQLTADIGAGSVTRIEPLSVPLVFVIWLAFKPTLLQKQIESPLLFTAIMITILASVFFAIRLRHCPLNRAAFTQMIPVILTSAGLNLLCKGCTEHMNSDTNVIMYIFVMSSLASLIAFKKADLKQFRFIVHRENGPFLKVAALLSFSLLIVISLRLFAFKGAANPAYASAIMLMGPFWILLLNRILKHKEDGNIFNGIGIVCSAIILALLTTL